MVRTKDYREILETLDEEWKNRGLYFDAEMVPYTDGEYKVLKRVNRIIDEKTGKMLTFKNGCLILDEVVCQARYAKCRKLCPACLLSLLARDLGGACCVARQHLGTEARAAHER